MTKISTLMASAIVAASIVAAPLTFAGEAKVDAKQAACEKKAAKKHKDEKGRAASVKKCMSKKSK